MDDQFVKMSVDKGGVQINAPSNFSYMNASINPDVFGMVVLYMILCYVNDCYHDKVH